MSDQDMLSLVSIALATGCGGAIDFLYAQYLEWRTQRAKPEPSAFDKRWTMIGLCVLVPSVLYIFTTAVMQLPISYVQDLAYIGAAFVAAQARHSLKLSRVGAQ